MKEHIDPVIAAKDAEIAALGEQLEADRTKVAECITAANRAIDSRYWLTEGRGPYEWDDDRYREEFKAAAVEIKTAMEPLTKIAANWSGCPMKSEDVAKARIDLKAQVTAKDAEIAKYKSLLSQARAHLRDVVMMATSRIGGERDEWKRKAEAAESALNHWREQAGGAALVNSKLRTRISDLDAQLAEACVRNYATALADRNLKYADLVDRCDELEAQLATVREDTAHYCRDCSELIDVSANTIRSEIPDPISGKYLYWHARCYYDSHDAAREKGDKTP